MTWRLSWKKSEKTMSPTEPPIPLLPCPFCGGEPFSEECHWQEHQGWHVGCTSCEICPIVSASSGDDPCIDAMPEAAKAWNTRVTPTPDFDNKQFREDLGVALAEAYVLIPKGMPWESASEKLEDAAMKIIRQHQPNQPGIHLPAEPSEEMCKRARGFIMGLDLSQRTWGAMRNHLQRGGYPTLPSITRKAEECCDGHITKWDVAECIYMLMVTPPAEGSE